MKRLGRHAIVDISGASAALSEDQAATLLSGMARACGATLLRIEIHHFGERHGLTAIAILAESHISLHEWPEHRYAAFDIFVCGSADPMPAIDIIKAHYPDSHVEARIIDRECVWHGPLAIPTA